MTDEKELRARIEARRKAIRETRERYDRLVEAGRDNSEHVRGIAEVTGYSEETVRKVLARLPPSKSLVSTALGRAFKELKESGRKDGPGSPTLQ